MILVDTSVWIDHLRSTDHALFTELEAVRVLCHPFVIGEIALGNVKARKQTLELLRQLPQAPVAHSNELLYLIEQHKLHGRGIGWTDAHLLASTLLAGDARLWTRDKRLHACAAELGIAMPKGKH